MNEVWKDINGYKGYYQISNFGRVKSLTRIIIRSDNQKQTILEKIIKPSLSNKRYYKIGLSHSGKRMFFLIHRLVGTHFIKNKHNKSQINHKNGIKTDNYFKNLEWSTQSDNQKHAFKTGLQVIVKGEKTYNAVLSDNQVRDIKIKLKKYTRGMVSQLAKKYNVKRPNISNIKCGYTWKHIKV